MGKQNKRVKAEAKDDVIFDTEVKKKKQKKEKQQAVGDRYNQVKNEPVEVKAEDVFSPNVEQQKNQQQKKEKHQAVENLTNKVKNERVEVKVEGDVTPNTKQKKRKQKKKKQQAVGDPNVEVKSERVEVKTEGDVTPNTEQKKKKRRRKKKKQQAVGGKNNEVKTKPNPTIANAFNGPVSVSVNASEGSPRKKKEKTQIKEKGLAEKNVQDHVVEPASNRAGKKRKRKQKKEQKVVNGNAKIDVVENVSSVTGDEISEGFEGATDSKTIAVSGFQSEMKVKKIFDHFSGFGSITLINMSTLSEEGKIRGLAYIEFKTKDAAKRALGLDGTKIKDRTLKVELSKVQPKKKDPPAKISGCKIAYIGNLPRIVKEDDIRQFFKDSKIESINIALFERGKPRCCGFGHVQFADDESLENAMKKDNVKLYDKPIKVAYPTEKYAKPSKSEGHSV